MRSVKITALLLALILMFTLTSCEKDREYDEAEVLRATADLIERAKPINEIFYGKGLSFTEEGAIGAYKPATPASLTRYGISTIDDLKALTRSVYSSKTSEGIFAAVLSPTYSGDSIVNYARYYQAVDDDGNPTTIMVRSNYEHFGSTNMVYHDGMTVKDVEGEVIIVSVPVTLTRESDGKVKNTTIDVKLIEEADGWRLCKTTYVVYTESTDEYDEMNK